MQTHNHTHRPRLAAVFHQSKEINWQFHRHIKAHTHIFRIYVFFVSIWRFTHARLSDSHHVQWKQSSVLSLNPHIYIYIYIWLQSCRFVQQFLCSLGQTNRVIVRTKSAALKYLFGRENEGKYKRMSLVIYCSLWEITAPWWDWIDPTNKYCVHEKKQDISLSSVLNFPTNAPAWVMFYKANSRYIFNHFSFPD